MAEQIPGTLFILLLALASFMIDDARPLLILATGCAAGWKSFDRDQGFVTQNILRVIALALWVIAFLFIAIRIL